MSSSSRQPARHRGSMKLDNSPAFDVAVLQHISIAKNEPSADSPKSPAPYQRDIISYDVAASLESKAGCNPTNLDGYPSLRVMQDLHLALMMVLVPSCSEAGKDSLSLSFNVLVPEGYHVDSMMNNLTEISDSFLEREVGIIASENLPSLRSRFKPEIRTVEAKVAGRLDKRE
ncbi:hypothetical protein K439DRAFT_1621472 [Ramaria rubella]|nr:hypothetical protein K439DRAFT_1621472 [Ramaria rubella]